MCDTQASCKQTKAPKSKSVISHVLYSQIVMSTVFSLFCINNHFILLKEHSQYAVSKTKSIWWIAKTNINDSVKVSSFSWCNISAWNC